MFAGRLKMVLGGVISKMKSAFLPRRQILDGVVVVNELLDWAKRNKESRLLLKVDFEKNYDLVNWSYLEYILRRMGFAERWCMWMRSCIMAGNVSVLVNGSPTDEFQVKRGLR